MKLKSIYRLAFLGSLVAIAGCSGDELDGVSSGSVPESVAVTLTVSRPGDASTRTVLTDNNDGTLTSKWTAGDKLLVVTSDGIKAGELTLLSGENTTTGVFTGDLAIADGTHATLWYLGASNGDAAPYTCATGSTGDKVTLTTDLSGKEGSPKLGVSFHDLKRAELLTEGDVEFTVKGGKGYVKTEGITLDQKMAMAHFSLIFPGDFAVSDGATLKVNSEKGDLPNVKTWLHANLAAETTYGYTFTLGDGKDIKISNNTADLYIPIIPGSYKLKFEVTSGSKQYSYSLTEESQISAGVYYTCGAPSYAGIKVELSEPTNNDYPGYENEDPRNPLHKFAKTNLTRIDGLTNGFAEEGDKGALYQWGRNYGYIDTMGAYEGTVYDNGDTEFNNFLDAYGSFTGNENGYREFDYYVYNPYNYLIYTGYTYGVADPAGIGFNLAVAWDEPKYYKTANEIKAHTDKYFMSWDSSDEDYWKFEGGGDNWYERAEACGYEKTNPCPDGWRLPTEDDFKMISPSQNKGGTNTGTSLTSLVNNSAELRQTPDHTKYVIRWSYSNTYLKIEAIVVDSDFKSSDIVDIIWENNDNVVTRIFPATGQIRETVLFYPNTGYDFICLPLHWGDLDDGYFDDLVIRPGGNYNDMVGSYWTDSDSHFEFSNYSSKFKASFNKSFLGIDKSKGRIKGYAIRPVMDK